MRAPHLRRWQLLCARVLAGATALLAAGSSASAQVPPSVDTREGPTYWGAGVARPFGALTLDAGAIYARAQLSIGYGKPFRSWVGADVAPAFASGALSEYAGLRFVLPNVNLRAGARYVITSGHTFLPVRPSYEREDLELSHGRTSRYLSVESELTGAVRAPLGSVFGVLMGMALLGVPRGERVFEEALHQIVEPPFVWRGRVGYALEIRALRAGVFGEIIDIPGRDAVVGRAGPLAGLRINEHLDLLASIAIVVASPDRLGFAAGDLAELGIRYRWATGEPAPFVPWR